MKIALIVMGLFSVTVFAAPPNVKLVALNPIQKSSLELGQLTVELISVKDDKTVATFSGKLGDCSDCVRGAALHGDVGFRFEGETLATLTVRKKFTSNVKIISCPQKFQDNRMTFEFTLNKKPMKLLFSVVQ